MLNPLAHRKILRKGIPGKATIVERGALDRGGTSFNLPMTLQVHVEARALRGRRPVDGQGEGHDRPQRLDPGTRRAATIRSGVAIDWDGVREGHEQEKAARRAALASGGPAGPEADGIAEAEQALRAMGLDIDLSGAQVTYGTPVEAELWRAVRPTGGDDMLSQLERLAALRDAGMLTEEEFAAQKQRILGGA